MQDEHYRVVMMFDALNKELYTLHQGYQEGMSKYSVQLAWHIKIIQTKFPRRIREEHLEGLNQDCFYEVLKEYQIMLAPQMEDRHLATYAKLLKAARFRNDSKANTPHHRFFQLDGSSNVWATASTTLFTPCRLKEKSPGTFRQSCNSGRWWRMGWWRWCSRRELLWCKGYRPQDTSACEPNEQCMVQFAKPVDLYQQKEHRFFWCGSANHLIHNCSKGLDSTTEVPFNSKEGMDKKGAQASQKKTAMQQVSQTEMSYM